MSEVAEENLPEPASSDDEFVKKSDFDHEISNFDWRLGKFEQDFESYKFTWMCNANIINNKEEEREKLKKINDKAMEELKSELKSHAKSQLAAKEEQSKQLKTLADEMEKVKEENRRLNQLVEACDATVSLLSRRSVEREHLIGDLKLKVAMFGVDPESRRTNKVVTELDEWKAKCESEEKQTEEQPQVGSTERTQEAVDGNKLDGEKKLTETKFQDIHQTTEIIQWKSAANGEVGPDAVAGGNEEKRITYVGRVELFGRFMPAKIVSEDKCCHVVHNNKELRIKEYEYLVKPSFGMLTWKSASNGQVPTGAVVGGRSADGEPLFVGRTKHEKELMIGMVQPSRLALRFAWQDKELTTAQYEVLCLIYNLFE